jgi:hypothetical protein
MSLSRQKTMTKQYQCPALGAQLQNALQVYYPTAQLPIYLRPLTHEELTTVDRFAPEVAKGRDHFQLFRIFVRNHKDLINTISSQLRVGELSDVEKVELDRVLLNFLASGRAITDHFIKYFDSQFGDSENREELKKYLARLREGSWAFAFIEDVRNYIQHQGLPVADYNRSFSPTSVKLNLTINAEKLCAEKKDPREWWYSKLNPSHGTFDLFDKLQEYYLRVTRDLGNFLAKWFVPNLVEAHKFFSGLAAEVKKKVPNGKMIVLTEFESDEGKGKHSFSFVSYPEDVFRELGLTVRV